jgi:hypothetical protein
LQWERCVSARLGWAGVAETILSTLLSVIVCLRRLAFAQAT